jgi:hypothetical protein
VKAEGISINSVTGNLVSFGRWVFLRKVRNTVNGFGMINMETWNTKKFLKMEHLRSNLGWSG